MITAYLLLGYMIVNNVQDDSAVTSPMVQGVRSQCAPPLANSPGLTAPGVTGQLGKELELLTVTVQSGWQTAIKEHTVLAYQQGINAVFKSQWGHDLKCVRLTAQGFFTG
ncbi:hypothetical protein [Deinococcus altitudinis]|uniref:hypothetical protein n=1 Tax=Deinococcus altitudinis TaxID=468914 RepID=UPI0038917E69